jgi:hypothetical protein
VIRAIRRNGLAFDRQTRTGVVLHMFNGLAIDGRIGVTAIARSGSDAELMYAAAVAALSARDAVAARGLPLPA